MPFEKRVSTIDVVIEDGVGWSICFQAYGTAKIDSRSPSFLQYPASSTYLCCSELRECLQIPRLEKSAASMQLAVLQGAERTPHVSRDLMMGQSEKR